MFRSGHGLFTVFGDNGRYSKPQPSLLPDVDSTLRHIAQWKHLPQIWQEPSTRSHSPVHDSKKYSTLVTPFWGVQVYARSAVSTPGSETALKELACRVLVHIARIADDLYCRENSPRKLPQNWRKELQALIHKCNLRLSPSKTIINPHSTTVVG